MTRILGYIAALALCSAPASAAITVCNQTSYVLYTALGTQQGSQSLTQGWTRIAPGDCIAPRSQPQSAAFYFLAARSSKAHSGAAHVWGGALRYCVKDVDFNLRTPLGAQACSADDAFLMPFAPVDTHGKPSWTTTLTETAQINSLDMARAAGIARLLGDNGYVIGPHANKTYAEALNKFRARMKLPDKASVDDLFDALETEALKVAAPAGYSICNDSDGDIWAAIGLMQGKDWVSRGWWHVAAGACAKAITAPLATDKIFLLAERSGRGLLVTGVEKFCYTDIEFEAHGRGKCASHGLGEAGFAATNTKGVTGYAAHIGDKGLLPAVQIKSPSP
jgi:uncharacterized membrane protein